MAGRSRRAEGLTRGALWVMPLGPRSSLLPTGKRAMRGWEQGVPGTICISYWPQSPGTPGGGQRVCSGFRPTKPEQLTDCGRPARLREPGPWAAKRGKGCGPVLSPELRSLRLKYDPWRQILRGTSQRSTPFGIRLYGEVCLIFRFGKKERSSGVGTPGAFWEMESRSRGFWES